MKNYRRTQQAKIIGAGREVVAQHKNGRCIPIRLAVGKVDRYPGEEQLFVGLITDISERRALEASLRETATRAEQAALVKSRFLANMSHEIRTPDRKSTRLNSSHVAISYAVYCLKNK